MSIQPFLLRSGVQNLTFFIHCVLGTIVDVFKLGRFGHLLCQEVISSMPITEPWMASWSLMHTNPSEFKIDMMVLENENKKINERRALTISRRLISGTNIPGMVSKNLLVSKSLKSKSLPCSFFIFNVDRYYWIAHYLQWKSYPIFFMRACNFVVIGFHNYKRKVTRSILWRCLLTNRIFMCRGLILPTLRVISSCLVLLVVFYFVFWVSLLLEGSTKFTSSLPFGFLCFCN